MKVKSMDCLSKTAEMLADEAGERIIHALIYGRIRNARDVINCCCKCGKGKDLVMQSKHTKIALSLVS